ncbi:LysR family transcriptional regulator [Peptococcus niger]|uniref:DNA-binding transcriptional regulator, LysR family n=1 Tax=Peptococcus niger TaxID=2741 RepID=A0A1G7AGI7_PEPNI|nr:LysR family transcriptional regulator [Peptococcus niger]SDE13577.1 DNA-binding transcriptional regulator, LysR family [Peptococcus niger]
MRLDDLKYFREVIKYGSISIAADKNFISQSTLSTAINRLEKDLGIELFYRNNHGVIATDLGKEVNCKVEKMLELAQEIEQLSDVDPFGNSVLLATTFAASEMLIPECLEHAKQEKIPLKLSVNVMEDYLIYNQVAAGFAKIGIGTFVSELLTKDLKFNHLFDDELILHVGPHSPLYDQDEIEWSDVLLQPYPAFGDEFLAHEAEYLPKEYFPKIIETLSFRCNSTTAIKKLVANQNYVCFLPAFNSKHDIYVTSGLLRTKKIKNLSLPIQYGYIENKRYKYGKSEQYFIDNLKKTVATLHLGESNGKNNW